MTAPANLSKVDQLRARDGEDCWLCGGKLDFAAVPNSKKAPTIEHLIAQSKGGTNTLSNLVLTHPGCNKQLGCKPVAEKQKIRDKHRRNQEKVKSATGVGASKVAVPPSKACVSAATLIPAAPARSSELSRLRASLRVWQAAALIGSAAALLLLGFAAGLLIGR